MCVDATLAPVTLVTILLHSGRHAGLVDDDPAEADATGKAASKEDHKPGIAGGDHI